MPAKFNIEVLTPGRVFYQGEVEQVIVPGLEGEIGILANHLPVVIGLKDGVLRIQEENGWKQAAIHGGFMEVEQKRCLIMSDAIEWPEEIDINRALAAKERAEERLRQRLSQQEYLKSQAAVSRALSRLRVTKSIK